MGLAADGTLTEINIAAIRTQPGKVTRTVKFTGNLPSTATTPQTVGGVTVFDSAGGSHNLSLVFTNTNSTLAGSWNVELKDGTTTVGTQQLVFTTAGSPTPLTQQLTFTFTPTGLPAMVMTFDFSIGVTSFASGGLPPLVVDRQDGFGAGAETKATFDSSGTLVLTYANGQTVKGAQLALARFDSLDAVTSLGNGLFDISNPGAWHTGVAAAGGFGTIKPAQVEISNVDMSQEFSDLVIMQRGYQASSQIISTANDMLQELFSMSGK
jgi:flagellar hook protein FlgE